MVKPTKFLHSHTRCPICQKLSRIKNGDNINDIDFINDVIRLYNCNNSMLKISKIKNISIKNVRKILVNNNIVIDGTKAYKKHTDEYILSVADEYINGATLKELSLKYDITEGTLFYRLNKLGVKTDKRIHQVDKTYFDNIDNQNKAYLLGFIMADGCVAKSDVSQTTENRLIISISHKDREVLEFMNEEMKSGYQILDYIPIGSYSRNMMSRLVINSVEICNSLKNLYVTPRKTGFERISPLKKEFVRHFLRGFLDGDGWVNKSSSFGFCSSQVMLKEIRGILKNELHLKGALTIRYDSRDKHLYYLDINRKDDVRILSEYLYRDSNFKLKRKFLNLT